MTSFMERKRAELQARGIDPARLPPGQYVTERFPVLHLGPIPDYASHADGTGDELLEGWSLTIGGSGAVTSRTLSWAELRALPLSDVTADIHCVTKWSRLDVTWQGVLLDDLLAICGVRAGVHTLLAHGEFGYSANLPFDELRRNVCLVALAVDGSPLTAEHGAPARLVVPHLYFWKSVKWLRAIELVADDAGPDAGPAAGRVDEVGGRGVPGAQGGPLGFWERNGYHEHGDPFREQRYWGDDE